jgi:non-specific serine/threonine protein kinase
VLIKIPLLPRQRLLYEMTRDACRASVMQTIDQRGLGQSRLHVLQALTRLRQICCHPLLVDPLFKGDSGKFEAFEELVDNVVAEKHKALVFSPFVSALDLIQKRLRGRAIRYEYLTGQTADRQVPVDAFQADPDIPLMLISLKAGGVGLNLTAADYVILLDPWWNPAVENQAADRAYRIGQTRPVFVYKLIAQDSVEERVLELQKAKKTLVDALLTPESGVFKSLQKEEIQKLFE